MSREERDRPKPEEDIVEGEVVAEFSDETLMNLPSIEKDARESIAAPKITEPVESGRRMLIVRLLMGGAAALALGGSAALLLNRRTDSSVVILPNGAQIGRNGTLDVAQLAKQIADLQRDLDSTTNERDQFKANLVTLSSQLEVIKPQLESARALNDLWKSLDDTGLDDLLSAALQLLTSALDTVMGAATILQNGVKDGQAALDYVVKVFPGPQDGIQWLSAHIPSLSRSLDDLSAQVQQAVQPVQPFAQLISNFVDWVLNQLPFNIGAKARSGMQGMQTVIGGLPDMVDRITNTVLSPLGVWFGDDPLLNLAGILLNPFDKKVLEPARTALAQMTDFNDSFQKQLVTPAQDALFKRGQIRAQIKDLQARSAGQGQ